jgi:23S rRNA (uracil1939-C5)-methyltransferase
VRFIEEVAPYAEGHVLELYSGSGFFSIPIAQRAKEIIAIESNRAAVRQARDNATANKTQSIRFVDGQVDTALRGAKLNPDVVVLDPPRAGCGLKVAEQIAAMKPKRIVYISCNPATFAREAGKLGKLKKLTLIDQFPNTYHIELVGVFERGD